MVYSPQISQQVIPAKAMPEQVIQPLNPGSTSVMKSVQIQQQQQIQKHMELIGKSGGSTRRKSRSRKNKILKGGLNNTRILVPSVQPGTVNSQQTAKQFADLTKLASKQQSEASFDDKVNQKGGKIVKKRVVKGGTCSMCKIGGKKSIKNKKNRKKGTRKIKHYHRK